MQLSRRTKRLSASPIRELLKSINRPGIISFAGGLPASDSFPDLNISDVSKEVLQYGPSEGESELRAHIAEDLKNRGLQVKPEQVLVLSGSQQGIDLVAKLMVDQGTTVAVEAPTYLAALQVFSLFGARYTTYDARDLSALDAASQAQLLYTIPTFQNPTGHCYSAHERQALAARADALSCVLFEDDPYRDLAYDTCDRTPVCAYVERTSWIYQSSFSKTFAPGLRLGYLVCSEDLYEKLVWLKQAADLHSNRLSQTLVLEMLNTDSQRLEQLVQSYRIKRDQFQQQLCQHMSSFATWTEPAGGLFFWLQLKQDCQVDMDSLLQQSMLRNVAFMPGTPFFTSPVSRSYMRLNFSHANTAQMQEGLSILAELIEGAG